MTADEKRRLAMYSQLIYEYLTDLVDDAQREQSPMLATLAELRDIVWNLHQEFDLARVPREPGDCSQS